MKATLNTLSRRRFLGLITSRSGRKMAKRINAQDLDEQLKSIAGVNGLRTISDWVASTSIWVDPAVYERIQVVFPHTRRLSGKEEFRATIDGVVVWQNEPAAYAFWRACGVSMGGSSPRSVRNAILCHIYENTAHDPRHFTNLANLTALPKALASFTEWQPIRELLKWESFSLYGYRGPHGTSPSKPSYVPAEWAKVQHLSPESLDDIVIRLIRLRTEKPGHTPRKLPNASRQDAPPHS